MLVRLFLWFVSLVWVWFGFVRFVFFVSVFACLLVWLFGLAPIRPPPRKAREEIHLSGPEAGMLRQLCLGGADHLGVDWWLVWLVFGDQQRGCLFYGKQ